MSGVLLAAVGNSYGYKPINTVAPAITGTAQARQTLTCSTGTWNAAPLPITYSYQWKKNGSNISGATNSTYVVLSVDVGSIISCTVTATNAVGATSADSNTTATVIANVPAAPTIGTATATGSSTATVTFTPPADNGGATITSYTAISSPGGLTATGSSSPLTVTGLAPATNYTFVVRATNSVGNSANSSSSNSITTQEAYWVALTNDYGPSGMGIVPAGTSIIVGGGKYDYAFSPSHAVNRAFRLSSAGAVEVFAKQYGGANNTTAGLYSDSAYPASYNSGIYFGASSQGGYANKVGFIYGIDSSGNVVLNSGVAQSGRDINCRAAAMDSSGNAYLLGTCWNGSQTTAFVAKFNSSGTLQWAKTGNNSGFSGYPTGGDASTSYVALPASNSSWGLPKVLNSSNGAQVWGANSYNPSGSTGGTSCMSAVLDGSGNSYFSFGGNFAGGISRTAVTKFNTAGTEQWTIATNYDYTQNAKLSLGSDGFLYLIGQDQNAPQSTYVVKISTAGSHIWTRRIKWSGGNANPGNRATVIGSSLYVPFRSNSTTTIIKVPTDGSKTGTYGNYTWEASGPGMTSAGLSVYQGGWGVMDPSPALSQISSPAGASNYTITSTVTNIP